MSTKVFGTTAVYARKLRNEAMLSCVIHASLLGVALLSLYVYTVFGINFSPLSLAPPFVLFVYASYMFSSSKVKYAKASVGVQAEVKVLKTLVRCAPYAVVNGSMLGFHGDIDHIVVGPCLATVETKYGVGKVSFNLDKNLVCGGKVFNGNPVKQAARAASLVSKHSGFSCNAVLVVTDSTTPPFKTHDGVTVCSLKDLVSVLSSFPFIKVTESTAVDLAKSLHK